MATTTLKSLHAFLRLLENTSELKRKMPPPGNPRSLKESLAEMSKAAGLDSAAFKDEENIGRLLGPQRFLVISGEPSATIHVARIFDSAKILWIVLTNPGFFEKAGMAQANGYSGSAYQQSGNSTRVEIPGAAPSDPEREMPLDNLQPLFKANPDLGSRLFRALFEHMLGFASLSNAQQGSAGLVTDLTGNKDHRSFLATAMFVLGSDVDRENLKSFMLGLGLLGMPIFEQLLQNREYCDAFYASRRLERAFVKSSPEEETQLRNRMNEFSAQFGGQLYTAKVFQADDQDKARVDAHLAAADLLEALALTPWQLSLHNALKEDSSNGIRSLKIIALHFERFANGDETKEAANKEIADHLTGFARQFSSDHKISNGIGKPLNHEDLDPHLPGNLVRL